MAMRIKYVNGCDSVSFVELLGGIFEHSPWVAERAYLLQPFASRDELLQVMIRVVRHASRDDRLKLLRQHPELAGKEARAGNLTKASKSEQAGAGLDDCSRDELKRIKFLNQAYHTRFGFPFIIAVSGLDKARILAEMERRLENPFDEEFATAVGEVEKIARIRLEKIIDE